MVAFIKIYFLIILCLVCFMLEPVVTSNQQSTRMSYFIKVENKRAMSNADSTPMSTSVTECIKSALQTNSFTSANFGLEGNNKICELFIDVLNLDDLADAPGWIYIYKELSAAEPSTMEPSTTEPSTVEPSSTEQCTAEPVISGSSYHIADSSLTASSEYSGVLDHGPENSRLDTTLTVSNVGAWVADTSDPNSWIQAHLGQAMPLFTIITQGRQDVDEWVEIYSLETSVIGITFQSVTDSDGDTIEFSANSDRNTYVENSLPQALVARFVRLYVIQYHGWQSLRWEIEGCPNYVSAD